MTIYWPKTPLAEDPVNDGGLAFEVPQEVLRRHGASVLEPSTAANSAVGRALRPTAYVSSVLLIPRAELTAKNNESLNVLLNPIGMRLPELDNGRDGKPGLPPLPEGLDTVPVVLQPAGQSAVVDAWAALQAIRAGAAKELSDQISLDHLMFASRWNGDLGGVPGPIQGFVPFGPGTAGSGYLDGPVALELPAIRQQEVSTLALGRRPVVAVLDTGIGRNTWLDIPELDTKLPVFRWKTGPHVKVDDKIQTAVQEAGTYLRDQDHRVEVITHPKDEPLTRNPLVGTQAWCFGHGLFCAGVIQQIAPDSTVLAVRVMGSDGVARESAVVAALRALVQRIDDALFTGDPEMMVDIVSLSMGYLFERPESEEALSPIAVQINELRNRGVLVVAAAGNSASSERFFPASLSTFSNALTTPPVISVGALNPNGSKALFTNEGKSVTCYATGTNVISTFPQDANASRQPLVQVPAVNRPGLPQFRQSPDVDDHRLSPFTVWTGSSFAAPHIAAHLAKALHDMAPAEATGIGKTEQAMKRAADAVAAVKHAANPPTDEPTTPPAPAP
ncbi:S8 family serine peptidase [Lentzea sp. BCCO 10_0856]|uniref:S8 family serine peptidase n=1 Tax=Lentzea miocenica TaxID=3095431 RepID=A0ABU4SWK4_9PSEU|nr:S8 family serine peptidase [Lentzea sp. BCCO 10_0856]MDX8030276.1 S8 family serine peptidase [Lentzea sp. BCCO 10_0856]